MRHGKMVHFPNGTVPFQEMPELHGSMSPRDALFVYAGRVTRKLDQFESYSVLFHQFSQKMHSSSHSDVLSLHASKLQNI